MKTIKKGMRIRIREGCPATKKSYLGYNEEMERLEGTCQIIDSIIGREIEVKASNYTWHRDDILTIPDQKKPSKMLFNPKELV